MNANTSIWRVIVTLAALAITSVAAHAQSPDKSLVVNLAAVTDADFMLPHDLTLTPDGAYLVVTDMGNDRIVLLDPSTLAMRHTFGEGVLSFPHDVVFDPQGRLLVADSGNDRVMVYTLDGVKATLIETWDDLPGVEGIAVAPDGSVYVALVQDNRVARLQDGQIDIALDNALGAKLDRPHDVEIATDEAGISIIASDPGNHRLIVFDPALNPLYEISTWDPPFTEPKYISIGPQGRIFVADQYNNRIRVFSPTSQPLGEFGFGDVKLPEGVLARDGFVWVSDTERGRIVLYRITENQ